MNLLHRLPVQENHRVVGVSQRIKEQYALVMLLFVLGGASYPLTGSTGDGFTHAF